MKTTFILSAILKLFCRRESLKQTITGDKIGREKSKKAGTFLCAKKNPKKKKKKMPYNTNYNDGGYPIYHTTSADGKYPQYI